RADGLVEAQNDGGAAQEPHENKVVCAASDTTHNNLRHARRRGHGTGGVFGGSFTRSLYSVVSTSFTTPRLMRSFSGTSPKSFVSLIHLSSASDISFLVF